MASFTNFLKLLKKNPATDGKDTFNIETMLNENWDKIDKKVEENSSAIGQIQGKIINSSGSNANGEWIRFEDGTQICDNSVVVNGVANTDVNVDWLFPASFVSNPRCSVNLSSAGSTNNFIIDKLAIFPFYNVNKATLVLRTTQTQAYSIQMIAIGRWK